MWLECIINYWGDDDESMKPKRKFFHRSILVNACSYTEGEALTTDWASKNIDEEFDISPIRELQIQSVYFLDEEPKNSHQYYKCDCQYSYIDFKGREKVEKVNVVIQEKDPNNVHKKVKELIDRDYLTTCIVNKISLLKIEDVIL